MDNLPADEPLVETLDKETAARRDRMREEEAELVEDARVHKAEWEQDLRELYFFAAPHRARTISSRTKNSVKPLDAGESNTSFAIEMAQDFATVIMTTFTPEVTAWVAREPGLNVPEAVADSVRDKIAAEDKKIFQAISASNFYAEAGMGFMPDLATGTVAMWIDDPRPYAGVECQTIPLHELEICTGPSGTVDFRSHVQHVRVKDLPSILDGVKAWPRALVKLMRDKKERLRTVEVRKSFWRDWSVKTDVAWKHAVIVDTHVVHEAVIRGAGCCPLIVARFGAMKEWAFGAGPGIQALPDFRHLDELAAAKILNCDISLRPPIAIPDDSVVNFEEGIEAGYAYPVRVGSEDAIKNMYDSTSPNVAIYDRSDVEQRIKRLHFLDFPDQLGKTPPSATQWLDEMTMAQRRIGTPGQAFWGEWCVGVFERFEYLLAKRGVIAKVKHNGADVSLRPVNPARKSADQQEVAQAARVIEIAGQAFPEEWKLKVDGGETIKNLVKKGGAENIIVMRKADEVQNVAGLIAKVAGGQTPGAPMAAANAGQPAGPTPMGPPPPPPPQVQIRAQMAGGNK
ncbi:MAG: hypothetical protein KGJ45_11635 [Elusimicrobia bacterium]|nr:hypothetical protein [Elusimicrobiota bacterium]